MSELVMDWIQSWIGSNFKKLYTGLDPASVSV